MTYFIGSDNGCRRRRPFAPTCFGKEGTSFQCSLSQFFLYVVPLSWGGKETRLWKNWLSDWVPPKKKIMPPYCPQSLLCPLLQGPICAGHLSSPYKSAEAVSLYFFHLFEPLCRRKYFPSFWYPIIAGKVNPYAATNIFHLFESPILQESSPSSLIIISIYIF